MPIFLYLEEFLLNGAWLSWIPSPLKWPQWSLLCRDGWDTQVRHRQRRKQQPRGCSRPLLDFNTLLVSYDVLIRTFAIWLILGKVWMNRSGDFVVCRVEFSIFDFSGVVVVYGAWLNLSLKALRHIYKFFRGCWSSQAPTQILRFLS